MVEHPNSQEETKILEGGFEGEEARRAGKPWPEEMIVTESYDDKTIDEDPGS